MYYRSYFNIYNRKNLTNLLFKRSFSIYNNELQSKLKSGKLTYYDVLQVPQNADKNAIKKAYLKLVKEYHPDRSKAPDSRSIFICIKESHDVLSDSGKRILYDQKLMQLGSRIPKFKASRTHKKPMDSDADPSMSERWERYKRYTSGLRNDTEDDPYTWIKTLGAILISGVVVTIVCFVSGESLARLPASSCVDEGYTDSDVKLEKMVQAFYNPFTSRWERIIEPFEAPRPNLLVQYYLKKNQDDNVPVVPIRQLTTAKMPLSHTSTPSLLYDGRRRRPVFIEN